MQSVFFRNKKNLNIHVRNPIAESLYLLRAAQKEREVKTVFRKKKTGKKERQLLEELYELYEQKMYAAAFSILGHTDQAEDAVHDAFIKLVDYLTVIDSADSEKSRRLVMRILKTTAVDRYRKNHRESEHNVSEVYLEDKKIAVFPMQAVEDREYLSSLLHTLPEASLDVIRLRCYYGFSAKETAQILDVSEDVVNKRLERARKQIQQSEGVEINERKENQTDFGKLRGVHTGRAN